MIRAIRPRRTKSIPTPTATAPIPAATRGNCGWRRRVGVRFCTFTRLVEGNVKSDPQRRQYRSVSKFPKRHLGHNMSLFLLDDLHTHIYFLLSKFFRTINFQHYNGTTPLRFQWSTHFPAMFTSLGNQIIGQIACSLTNSFYADLLNDFKAAIRRINCGNGRRSHFDPGSLWTEGEFPCLKLELVTMSKPPGDCRFQL